MKVYHDVIADDLTASVVVATYNREKVLCNTLKYLLQQDYPHIEIIVVDQTPIHDPHTEEFLRAHRQEIQWIRLEKPSLPSARNVGIYRASGDIVIFVDDDVVLPPSFVRAHVALYADPNVGGVAGRVVPLKGGAQFSSGIVAAMDGSVKKRINFNTGAQITVDQAHGSNMSFRHELLTKIQGFETLFDGNSFLEETDVCFRITHAEYLMRFAPDAWSIHLAVADGGCGNRERGPLWYYWILHNTFLFALRHYSVMNFPIVIWNRMQDLFTTDPLLLLLLPAAILHSFISYLRAR